MSRSAAAAQTFGPRRVVRRWEALRGIGRSRFAAFSLSLRTVALRTTRVSIAIARFAARAYIDLSVWQHLATTWNHNPEGICGATASSPILLTRPRHSRRLIQQRNRRPTLAPTPLRQRRRLIAPA